LGTAHERKDARRLTGRAFIDPTVGHYLAAMPQRLAARRPVASHRPSSGLHVIAS